MRTIEEMCVNAQLTQEAAGASRHYGLATLCDDLDILMRALEMAIADFATVVEQESAFVLLPLAKNVNGSARTTPKVVDMTRFYIAQAQKEGAE